MKIDWQLKRDALRSRLPGIPGLVPGTDPRIVQADQTAFALDRIAALRGGDEGQAWSGPEIVHPLSGKRSRIGTPRVDDRWEPPSASDWAQAAAAYQRHLDGLHNAHTSERQQYASVWRLMTDCPDGVPDSIRPWWKQIPADARIPTVNLWDHQSLVSALVGVDHPALVQFNFAGAQEFIQSARRTQDLWASSYLIATLVWAVIRTLCTRYGPDCILQPALRGQPLGDLWLRSSWGVVTPPLDEKDLLVANIPNIFTALVSADDLPEIMETAVAEAQREWERLARRVRHLVEHAVFATFQERLAGEASWSRMWGQQTGQFLHGMLFWAAVPLPIDLLRGEEVLTLQSTFQPLLGTPLRDLTSFLTATENSTWALYAEHSALTARLLQDRKQIRDFEQSREAGQKCTLCGLRSALHPQWGAANTEEAGSRQTALTDPADTSRHSLNMWWARLAGISQQPYKLAGRLRGGDRLCAVCLTKRLVMQAHFDADPGNTIANPRGAQGERRRDDEPEFNRHLFPSTAGIANAAFIQRALHLAMTDGTVKQTMEAYTVAVKTMLGDHLLSASLLPAWERVATNDRTLRDFCAIDGEFLYAETYDLALLRSAYPQRQFEVRAVTDALQACRNLIRAVDAAEKTSSSPQDTPMGGRPCRYYAIIHMDGDQMGQWVSGQLPQRMTVAAAAHSLLHAKLSPALAAQHRPLGPAIHQALSTALGEFALHDARRIVEEDHIGKLLYAGGDDVLAMVPLESLLPILNALYCAYRGLSGETFGEGYVQDTRGVFGLRMGEGTLSAGVAIVHESASLSQAMEQARAAEDFAKDRLGRDAVAFFLHKRSGAPLQIGAQWRQVVARGEERMAVNVLAAVQQAVDLMRRGLLSSALATSLQDRALTESSLWNATSEASKGSDWSPSSLVAARQALFRRIASRHLAALDSTDPARDEQQMFVQKFTELLGGRSLRMPTGIPYPCPADVDAWTQAVGLLTIARTIALGGLE